MSETPADEQVLADPGSYTVEQVASVFNRSSADEVEAAQTLEAAGKDRSGITGWERPSVAPVEPGAETFSRERLLGSDGPAITGHPVHVIAGALYGDAADQFERSELEPKIQAFLEREVEEAE